MHPGTAPSTQHPAPVHLPVSAHPCTRPCTRHRHRIPLSLSLLFADGDFISRSTPSAPPRLGALCGGGPHVSGSLTDIVANGRDAVAHSWHADSGLPSGTVMVGFPESDSYEGAGVFSHVARRPTAHAAQRTLPTAHSVVRSR